MNLSKTKIMSDTTTYIITEDRIVKNINVYVYLGHAIKLGKKNQTAEINRRIGLTWAAFGRLRYILKDGTIPINLKRKVYKSCILSVAYDTHREKRKSFKNNTEGNEESHVRNFA